MPKTNNKNLLLKPLLMTLLLLLCPTAFSNEISAAVNKIYAAYQQGDPSPLITADFKQLTLQQAYIIQKGFVNKRQRNFQIITGYKGGLTAFEAPQAFALSEPVVGTLFSKDRVLKKNPHFTVSMANFHQLMIETEIAFVFKEDVEKSVNSVKELKTLVRAVAPVVELPDLGFDKKGFDKSKTVKPSGLDLVANNVAAKKYILGRYLSSDGGNINAIITELRCGEESLSRGLATHAMGGQWDALLWITNNLLSRGIRIREEQIIITGALGGMTKAKPCAYVADFGALGRIEFTVTE